MVIRNRIKVLKSNLCSIKIFAGLWVGAAKYLPCRYIRFGHFCEPVHLICEIFFFFLNFVNSFTRHQWDCGMFLDCNCCNMSGTPSFPVVTEFIKTKWRPGQHATSLHLNLLSLPKLPSFGHVFFSSYCWFCHGDCSHQMRYLANKLMKHLYFTMTHSSNSWRFVLKHSVSFWLKWVTDCTTWKKTTHTSKAKKHIGHVMQHCSKTLSQSSLLLLTTAVTICNSDLYTRHNQSKQQSFPRTRIWRNI